MELTDKVDEIHLSDQINGSEDYSRNQVNHFVHNFKPLYFISSRIPVDASSAELD